MLGLILAAMLVMAPQTGETDMRHARGTFDVTITPVPSAPETAPDVPGRMTLSKTFHGDLTGTGAGARAASSAMQSAFLRFARTGEVAWPTYALPRRATMVFDAASRVVDDPRGDERRLFAKVPFIQSGT